MGELDVKSGTSSAEMRNFMKHLLNDVSALEYMLKNELFETDIRRIGAEQEFFIVDKKWRPYPIAMDIMKVINDPHFTTEIAQFNLEVNLDPQDFGQSCLKTMESNLQSAINHARKIAQTFNADIALTGILPTIRKQDLNLENMTPYERYYALNDAIKQLKGEDYFFRIKGVDELSVTHDSVMLESCNTSFQLHFQVSPNNFAKLYNFAQVVTAPLLAVSVNSPMLFGRRLWQENRIALFQQAVDTRGVKHQQRERQPRVTFGSRWLDNSVLELFQEDISRFRVLLGRNVDEDPQEKLRNGEIPKLQALCLHNGTVYRWNRPCYGIYNGRPHLRIENRVIPSGPTVKDAIANAAFYFGLMSGMSREYEDVTKYMPFENAGNNFVSAARNGLEAQFRWLDKHVYTSKDLILSELLPMARHGLKESGIDKTDIDHYLGIIRERVKTSKTGSYWILNSFQELKEQTSKDAILSSLTAAMVKREKSGKPVHKWSIADSSDVIEWKEGYKRVEQFMVTDIYTCHAGDLINLAARIMDWQKVRHIPVENNEGQLIGLISYRQILRKFGEFSSGEEISVGDVMTENPITVGPQTRTIDAIDLMKKNGVTCLPVVENGQLVGMVRETDFINIASNLLYEKLAESE
ncbi:MAG: CBS domain-containing protein [Calditrichaeota bacterium]|nr:CBS domain-containing protein [Calditrichota bacterium]